ncbi:MAG: hypothetical protein Q8K99_06150 [Actinomycetota bacterium]|nr:hypothetical protein [Actinomycetota bacterium]
MNANVNEPMEETDETEGHVHNTLAPSVVSERDVEVTASFAGIVNAQGGATLNQSGACTIFAQGNVDANQAGAAAIVTRTLSGEGVYAGAIVAGDVSVGKSWVGLVLSPNMQVSEDSRVIIGPVAALIIALAIFGVFGVVAALGFFAARRAMTWRPRVPAVSWHRMGE